MRATTRLAWASILLVVLMIAVLLYDLSVVRSLATAQEELTTTEQRAMTLTLELQRLLARVDELTRKLFVTRDPDYAEAVARTRAAFEARLIDLESLQLSAEGREIVQQLAQEWRALPLTALSQQAIAAEPGSEEDELLLSSFLQLSQTLLNQTDAVTAAAEQTVADRVRQAAEVSRKARTFSWIAAISVLALTLPTLWLTISSIRRPLQRLHEGAQSVARGEYDYRIEDLDEGEFAELATKFNEMVRSLESREQHGRNVLSHLSHELKTPLVAMQETNRLLLDELSGPLNVKQKRLIDLNLESSQRLAEMISKLLDFARLEEGVLEFALARADLAQLASRAAEAFSARAAEAGVELGFSAPRREIEVSCDPDRITQIIMNLLDNAIKFSPRGSSVKVAIEETTSHGVEPNRTAVLEVIDQGPGVPPEKREAIFERFTQLEGAKRTGIGLGLAISRQIARAHRGSLTVTGNEYGGSTFSLKLPVGALPVHRVSGVGA